MIESPTKNGAFTIQQLIQIEQTKAVLSGIENETAIARKSLEVANKDVVKALKEKAWILEQTETMSKSLDQLKKDEASTKASLEHTLTELKKVSADTAARKLAVEEREKAVAALEKSAADTREKADTAHAAILAEAAALADKSAAVKRSMEAFAAAAKTITWS